MIRSVYAFLPRLSSKLGHCFPYHLALQEALHFNGWDYIAYFPQRAHLPSVPSTWKPVLANDLSESPKGLVERFKILCANILPMRRIFRKIEEDSSAIVFIEHFELQHLASILLALFFLKPKFQFWILFRYEFEGKKLKLILSRLFLRCMERKLRSVKCLTDSDLLADALKTELKRPFLVVPIPHTDSTSLAKKPGKNKEMLLWWPGGLIREDKGLKIVSHLLDQLKGKEGIKLVAAEAAQQKLGNAPFLRFIPTYLTPEEYIGWMKKADLILLPYSCTDYARRTSGIFVEAITLGAIPVVTKGTWMAYEVSKFDLFELTFDWSEMNLLDRLEDLAQNKDILTKLEKMRLHYGQFHTRESFAATCEKIASLSQSR